MFSLSAFAVLAITAQFLFAGVDAGVLHRRESKDLVPGIWATVDNVVNAADPIFSSTGDSIAGDDYDLSVNSQSAAKRQNIETNQTEGSGPFNETIGTIAGGFNTSAIGHGPFDVNATFGLGDEGTSELSALFEYFIPAIFNGLTGSANNMNLTGVTGQPLFSVGLGFSPTNETAAGGFNFSSAFPQISGTFSNILSSLFNGSTVSTFPITPPGLNGTMLPFQGLNGSVSSFPGMNGTTLPSANGSYARAFPRGFPTNFSSSFPTNIPTDLPTGIPTDLPSGSMIALPNPTFHPSVLPFPIPSDVVSSIQVELSSIAVSISEALPSIPSVSSSVFALPTAPAVSTPSP